MKNIFLRFWFTDRLPIEHIKVPKGGGLRLYFSRWFFHPIKRRVARFYLLFLRKFFGLTIIAVTGSAGKTTAKEMLASILELKGKTVWTAANIDPVYNIPTTILGCSPKTKYLILEMGVEFPGEMDFYLWLAQPKIGVVTTIYWTHTQFLGDIKGVAREKGKLIERLPKDGSAVLNFDDPEVRKLAAKTKAKVVWYGSSRECDVGSSKVRINSDLTTSFTISAKGKREEIRLKLLGKHFVPLALAAAGVGLVSGLSLSEIKRGLEEVEPQPHRMVPISLKNGVVIIDDTYNANPLATAEAIRVLSEVGRRKRKLLIFGEMRELGSFEKEGHREIGRITLAEGVDYFLGLGPLTKLAIEEMVKKGFSPNKSFWSDDIKEITKALKKEIRPGDVILLKGSRAMAMEEIVAALT